VIKFGFLFSCLIIWLMIHNLCIYFSELSNTCPHPLLTFLASSKFPPLESLYVIVNTIPVTNENPAGSQIDNCSYLVPLTDNCLRELLLAQLQKTPSTMTSNEESYLNEHNSSIGGSPYRCSSVDLLPDHARERDIRVLRNFRHRYALIHGSTMVSPPAIKGPSRYYLVQLSAPTKEPGSPRRQQTGASGIYFTT